MAWNGDIIGSLEDTREPAMTTCLESRPNCQAVMSKQGPLGTKWSARGAGLPYSDVGSSVFELEENACAPSPPSFPIIAPIRPLIQVEWQLIIDETIETFDQMQFRNNLATAIAVPASSIELEVTLGSLIVDSTITMNATDDVDAYN